MAMPPPRFSPAIWRPSRRGSRTGSKNTGEITFKVVGLFGAATLAHLFAEELFPGEGRLVKLHAVHGEWLNVVFAFWKWWLLPEQSDE